MPLSNVCVKPIIGTWLKSWEVSTLLPRPILQLSMVLSGHGHISNFCEPNPLGHPPCSAHGIKKQLDSVVYRQIQNVEDHSILQQDLLILEQWVSLCQMRFCPQQVLYTVSNPQETTVTIRI